ncbi:MAG: cache domain-containing protein [Gemmatimonas sp.]
MCSLCACASGAPKATATPAAPQPAAQQYEHAETQALVSLVNDAARLIQSQGEGAFATFRVPNSRWRQDETYIFVLDPSGNMLVHLDPAMEGKNQMGLKDVNGRPVIVGLLNAATATPGKPQGWYHYQWPVPGGLLARWKSSYVREVSAPSGKRYVVGSGVYNDRMERAFVIDVVTNAAAEIQKRGRTAFPLFHDTIGPFLAKDAYVFVIDPAGRELVNPAFPNLEGRYLLDLKDTQGKPFVRAMLETVQARGSGWVDYMWPKPGESVSTLKSTYVTKTKVDGDWLLVGCGVYLADAPTSSAEAPTMDAPDLMQLVREGAAVFADRGARAFPEFRVKGSKWFSDETYFFVWDMDGERVFHAADPSIEDQRASDEKDVIGRPYGKMFLEAAASPAGEGWVHFMYPEPGGIFPVWKSTFVKRVRFPSAKDYLVGAGVYRMQMDKAFVEDLVNRAASRIEARGEDAFAELRDKTGPYYFMDTYVFVDRSDGVEVVNAAQPSIQGVNIIDVVDAKGQPLVRNYIGAALEKGATWVDYWWYKPGQNEPRHKQAYVRAVRYGARTYIVGSGIYVE